MMIKIVAHLQLLNSVSLTAFLVLHSPKPSFHPLVQNTAYFQVGSSANVPDPPFTLFM